jgi:hypothetical protein
MPNQITYEVNPKVRFQKTSFQSCYGFINLYKKGFYFPLWTDLELANLTNTIAFDYALKEFTTHDMHLHPAEKSTAPPLSNYHKHFMLKSPFFFKCKEAINFLYTGASWDYVNNNLYAFHIPSAVIDFKTQHYIQVQFLLPIVNGFNESHLKFKAGDPIIYLMPMTEKKIKFINHALPVMEYEQLKLDHAKQSVYSHKRYFRTRNK